MKKFFPGLVVALALVSGGCGGVTQGDRVSGFFTAERDQTGVALSSTELERGMARFRGFFENVTLESVREKTPELYAEEVWFNDTLKTLRGRQAVESYFLKTLDHVESFRTTVDDVAVSGVNVYVRWTMDVRFKGAKESVRTIGMTMLRFDREGRVVLHQDFWDSAAGFYEHLPVLGGVLRWIKSKI